MWNEETARRLELQAGKFERVDRVTFSPTVVAADIRAALEEIRRLAQRIVKLERERNEAVTKLTDSVRDQFERAAKELLNEQPDCVDEITLLKQRAEAAEARLRKAEDAEKVAVELARQHGARLREVEAELAEIKDRWTLSTREHANAVRREVEARCEARLREVEADRDKYRYLLRQARVAAYVSPGRKVDR